ncbi:helix-turn-helix domain-containing protein [Synechococcus lacustris]|uniref:Insertion element IS150 protein InsJ-like helix-turn-helix domain-containing protein n=1 Tax=Synechococcus lacustris str. Tous TaxID=1910958 RepID=A0A2P7EAM7_9SYNE|nr:hypothetical protein C7K08_14155 [Synechococcus lacustris str. Tous]
MSPPSRETVTEISRATGISRQTLYSWRHLWKREGELVAFLRNRSFWP